MDLPIGIDFGGTGIKGAPVDLTLGDFAAPRRKVPTPKPATPEAVAQVLSEILAGFDDCTGGVGVTIPGVVRRGVVHTAANIDASWIGTDADALLTERLGRDVHVLNDADAAGLAEVRYGAAQGADGLVVVTTLGTGIGSALLHDGHLIPNSELGHVPLEGMAAEKWAANSVRERDSLEWAQWAARLTSYYRLIEDLLTPDLFVVGGGVSGSWSSFGHLIDIRTPIVPAQLRNRAGIVGAALAARTPTHA